jgi:hypothetical protein
MISQVRTGSTDFYPQLYTQQLQAVAAHFLIQLPVTWSAPGTEVWSPSTRAISD